MIGFHLALVPVTIITCEIALRLPLNEAFAQFRKTSLQAFRVVRSMRISDHWKERVFPLYAANSLRLSLTLMIYLAVIALPAILTASLASGSVKEGAAALMRPVTLIEMTLVGVAYIAVRLKLRRGVMLHRKNDHGE